MLKDPTSSERWQKPGVADEAAGYWEGGGRRHGAGKCSYADGGEYEGGWLEVTSRARGAQALPPRLPGGDAGGV